MKDEKCFVCGQMTAAVFLREVVTGIWPMKKKVKVCIMCMAMKLEGWG